MKGAYFLLVPALAVAGYTDLISSPDGSVVAFRYSNSFSSGGWYRWTPSGVLPVDGPVVSASPHQSIYATYSYGVRRCDFAGSTCWLADDCRADWQITGPGWKINGHRRQSEIRVEPSGSLVWFQQTGPACNSLGPYPLKPALNGLYSLPDLQPVLLTNGSLASFAPGARVITPEGKVLLLSKGQLSFAGNPISQREQALEAVVTSDGGIFAYAAASGRIRITGMGRDIAIGIGRSPRLSDDGSVLAYITPEGIIQPVGIAANEFTLSGDGNWIFAVNPTGDLARVNVSSGVSEVIVRRTFDGVIRSAALAPPRCPFPCWTDKLALYTRPGHLVVLDGQGFDEPGWTVATGDVEVPLQRLSANQFFYFFTTRAEVRPAQVRFFNHSHPIEFYVPVEPDSVSIGCFGALHDDFSAEVTAADPARVGEVLHFFITGAETIPPSGESSISLPPFAQPELFQPIFAGPAPGLTSIQQIDVRVLKRPETGGGPLFATDHNAESCVVPPIVEIQ